MIRSIYALIEGGWELQNPKYLKIVGPNSFIALLLRSALKISAHLRAKEAEWFVVNEFLHLQGGVRGVITPKERN